MRLQVMLSLAPMTKPQQNNISFHLKKKGASCSLFLIWIAYEFQRVFAHVLALQDRELTRSRLTL